MRTRTLLLLSLGCGLAILLAGVGMFWRLSNQEASATATLGVPTQIGDLTVTVVGSAEVADGAASSTSVPVVVEVRFEGPPDDEPARNFTLLVDGETLSVDSTDCPALVGDPVDCTVSFAVGADQPGARLLSYRRGEERAVWVLPVNAAQ